MENPKFGKCCLSGKIELPKLEPPPQPLRGLLEGDQPQAKNFHSDIRQYNMALSFTSLGADIDHALMAGGGGPPVFQLHGAMYHLGGTLLPPPDNSPKYAQLYIWDAALAKEVRQGRNPNLDHAVLGGLQDMLLEHNPFVPLFKDALTLMEDLEGEEGEEDDHLHVRLTYKPFSDPRRYNLPTSDDIAVILPGDGTSEGDKRDIILHQKGGGWSEEDQ